MSNSFEVKDGAAPGIRIMTRSSVTPAANSGATLLDQDWQGARRNVSPTDVEPRTYFITWTCYGTWLHGDDRGSVDGDHNGWQMPQLEADDERERREFELLKHAPVTLVSTL